jgi:hypothetical protein
MSTRSVTAALPSGTRTTSAMPVEYTSSRPHPPTMSAGTSCHLAHRP